MPLGVQVTSRVHKYQHSALLWIRVWLAVSMSVYLCVGVSGSVSLCALCVSPSVCVTGLSLRGGVGG